LKKESPLTLDNGLVIQPPRQTNTYNMDFSMAFVTGNNQQVCALVSCRDYMHDTIRTKVNNNKRINDDGHSYHPKAGDPNPCMDRLRLLVRFRTAHVDKFNMGLKALNDMEVYAEDMEKTTSEFVQVQGKNDATWTHVLLKGSKEYMDIPHLLSLVTLTLRFFTLNPKMDYKEVGDITRVYKNICDKGTILKDKYLMESSHLWMHHVLKNRAELFAEKALKEMYPLSIGYSFHSQGGIMELCKANSPNKDVNARVKELQKRYKQES